MARRVHDFVSVDFFKVPAVRDWLGWCLGCVILLASMLGCSGAPKPLRVLFIGVDGLEWSVIVPMVQEGQLPHLRALMERGVYGKLETLDPTLSPVIWTTIATGKLPEKHGVHHFYLLDPKTREMRLYNSSDRRVRALWNILSDHGLRVHVVGWFLTYPAEPIRGFMVSQYTSLQRALKLWKGTLEEGIPHQTYPESFLEQLKPEIQAAADEARVLQKRLFGGDVSGSSGELETKLVQHTVWAVEADTLYARIAEKIIRADPAFDFMAVYFGATDVAAHRFWRYYRPEGFSFPPSPQKRDRFGKVVPDTYRMADEWIGRLLALCGNDVTVFVVSDHGMYPIKQHVNFDNLQTVQQMNSADHLNAARAPGVIVAAGPGIRKGGEGSLDGLELATIERRGSVLDITPTLLYLLGVPVGRDMDGGLMEAVLDPAFRERHALLEVDTDEKPQADAGAVPLDEGMDREMLERFKSLGYIKDD